MRSPSPFTSALGIILGAALFLQLSLASQNDYASRLRDQYGQHNLHRSLPSTTSTSSIMLIHSSNPPTHAPTMTATSMQGSLNPLTGTEYAPLLHLIFFLPKLLIPVLWVLRLILSILAYLFYPLLKSLWRFFHVWLLPAFVLLLMAVGGGAIIGWCSMQAEVALRFLLGEGQEEIEKRLQEEEEEEVVRAF